MKVEIKDADALKRITPKALKHYLDAKCWKKTGTYGEYSDVYESDFYENQLIVPRTDIIADYARVVRRLLVFFAEVIEGVDQITAYNALIRFDDTIFPTRDDIITQLMDSIRVSEIPVCGWVSISTEFLDRHNDCISIYARYHKDGGFNNKEYWEIHDDGYTMQDLEMSGIKIPEKTLKAILEDYGVGLDTDKLLAVYPDKEQFTYRVHCLLQAMIILLNWKPQETEKEPSKWLGL